MASPAAAAPASPISLLASVAEVETLATRKRELKAAISEWLVESKQRARAPTADEKAVLKRMRAEYEAVAAKLKAARAASAASGASPSPTPKKTTKPKLAAVQADAGDAVSRSVREMRERFSTIRISEDQQRGQDADIASAITPARRAAAKAAARKRWGLLKRAHGATAAFSLGGRGLAGTAALAPVPALRPSSPRPSSPRRAKPASPRRAAASSPRRHGSPRVLESDEVRGEDVAAAAGLRVPLRPPRLRSTLPPLPHSSC